MTAGAPRDRDGDEVAVLVERAFHYRGDVTVRTAAGTEVTGYLFNRDAGAEAPRIQLFETETGREIEISYGDIRDVQFTGRDTAAPKQAAGAPEPAGSDHPQAPGPTGSEHPQAPRPAAATP